MNICLRYNARVDQVASQGQQSGKNGSFAPVSTGLVSQIMILSLPTSHRAEYIICILYDMHKS